MNTPILNLDWETTTLNLQKEDDIRKARNTAENLQRQYDNGLTAIEVNPEIGIIAHATLWKTRKSSEVHELGSIWVHPKFRGLHLSSLVFRRCMKTIIEKPLKAFLVTGSPRITSTALERNWVEADEETRKLVLKSTKCGEKRMLSHLQRMGRYGEATYGMIPRLRRKKEHATDRESDSWHDYSHKPTMFVYPHPLAQWEHLLSPLLLKKIAEDCNRKNFHLSSPDNHITKEEAREVLEFMDSDNFKNYDYCVLPGGFKFDEHLSKCDYCNIIWEELWEEVWKERGWKHMWEL